MSTTAPSLPSTRPQPVVGERLVADGEREASVRWLCCYRLRHFNISQPPCWDRQALDSARFIEGADRQRHSIGREVELRPICIWEWEG